MSATFIGRCLTARATHASHRTLLRGFGLSVGIAIALSGCSRSIFVWTAADVFGLGLLALVATAFLLLLIAHHVDRAIKAVRRRLGGRK